MSKWKVFKEKESGYIANNGITDIIEREKLRIRTKQEPGVREFLIKPVEKDDVLVESLEDVEALIESLEEEEALINDELDKLDMDFNSSVSLHHALGDIAEKRFAIMLNSKCMRPATLDEYNLWLRGFLKRGGSAINISTWNGFNWFTITRDMIVFPLYGTDSCNLIVSEGVKLTIRNLLGHNTVFYMDDFTTNEPDHVIIYE